MKKWIFLFCICSNTVIAQTTFTVNNIAAAYYGKVFIADTSEVFSRGWVAVFDKKNNRQLIRVDAEELAIDLHNEKLLANIHQLPYGEQSVIMYEDFNFDGIKDFAIEDGQNSCYHGPSFQVFLATRKGFILNADFTRLAQEYCGMFEVNAKDKTIHTMTKDGCCWHQFAEFAVINNKPVERVVIEEDAQNFPYITSSRSVWNGKKMVKTSVSTIDLEAEEIKIVLRFKVEQNQKEVVLFNINNRTLNYALLDKNGALEFYYPAETVYQNPDFTFHANTHTVRFKNKTASYSIFSDGAKTGIDILTGGKSYHWVGSATGKTDHLQSLLTTALDNVVME